MSICAPLSLLSHCTRLSLRVFTACWTDGHCMGVINRDLNPMVSTNPANTRRPVGSSSNRRLTHVCVGANNNRTDAVFKSGTNGSFYICFCQVLLYNSVWNKTNPIEKCCQWHRICDKRNCVKRHNKMKGANELLLWEEWTGQNRNCFQLFSNFLNSKHICTRVHV